MIHALFKYPKGCGNNVNRLVPLSTQGLRKGFKGLVGIYCIRQIPIIMTTLTTMPTDVCALIQSFIPPASAIKCPWPYEMRFHCTEYQRWRTPRSYHSQLARNPRYKPYKSPCNRNGYGDREHRDMMRAITQLERKREKVARKLMRS